MCKLKLLARGPASEDREADIDGGIAPALEGYRSLGHRRLDARTYEGSCTSCSFGAVMPTEIILDKWRPERVKWRMETHCYGPRLRCLSPQAGAEALTWESVERER